MISTITVPCILLLDFCLYIKYLWEIEGEEFSVLKKALALKGILLSDAAISMYLLPKSKKTKARNAITYE